MSSALSATSSRNSGGSDAATISLLFLFLGKGSSKILLSLGSFIILPSESLSKGGRFNCFLMFAFVISKSPAIISPSLVTSTLLTPPVCSSTSSTGLVCFSISFLMFCSILAFSLAETLSLLCSDKMS